MALLQKMIFQKASNVLCGKLVLGGDDQWLLPGRHLWQRQQHVQLIDDQHDLHTLLLAVIEEFAQSLYVATHASQTIFLPGMIFSQ